MKRLIPLIGLVMLVVILASSSTSAVSDSEILPAYNNISSDKITANQTQASNFPAGATITITMYTGDGE